ncbi:MAG TPA: TolC family protein, partial [Elusimicrobiota bacterium]|nr:TolC family protein [Elusimicrobiota bacterium]
REDLEARRMQVRYERGAYWPNADVTGHYYTQRATYLDAIDWDVIVALRVPLYQGGTVSAHVAEALAAERQSSWRLEEMQRTIYTAVRKTHAELTAALRESAVLGDATAAAQKSYDALREEYRLGLVTNLDVLEALDFLQTQRTAHDDARLRAKELYLSLGAETETLP